MARIISVANQKGGVGKTATTTNLGVILALLGFRVLLLDVDAQANAGTSLGLKKEDTDERNICDVFDMTEDINDCMYQAPASDNLIVIPSSKHLASTAQNLLSRTSRELILDRALKKVKDQFDFILIDCPPSLSVLTINAFSCSDDVLIPVQTDELAYQGLDELKNSIKQIQEIINPDLKVMGILATFYNKQANDDNKVLKKLKKEGNLLHVIRRATDVKKGIEKGLTIAEMFPNHDVTLIYKKLAEQIIKGEV